VHPADSYDIVGEDKTGLKAVLVGWPLPLGHQHLTDATALRGNMLVQIRFQPVQGTGSLSVCAAEGAVRGVPTQHPLFVQPVC
jgi:hypothetical protein